MPGSKPSSALTRSRAPPFAMEPSTRLRVNQWTGKYVDSFLSGGNPIQALECVRVLADQQNQSCCLRTRSSAALFPLLKCLFVDPQLPGEDNARTMQSLTCVSNQFGVNLRKRSRLDLVAAQCQSTFAVALHRRYAFHQLSQNVSLAHLRFLPDFVWSILRAKPSSTPLLVGPWNWGTFSVLPSKSPALWTRRTQRELSTAIPSLRTSSSRQEVTPRFSTLVLPRSVPRLVRLAVRKRWRIDQRCRTAKRDLQTNAFCR